MNVLRSYFEDLFKFRKLIYSLSLDDFKVKYAGSYFGIVWAFIKPIVTILVFWFVFQVGFRNAPVSNVPYILWLIPAVIPWFFFVEAMNGTTGTLLQYSYLVKKMKFPIQILPVVKILSSLYVHLFFIAFIFFMYIIYGFGFDIYQIQVIYYIIALLAFLNGIGLILSALNVFIKDMREIVNIVLEVGFWLTPIFWSYSMLSDSVLTLFRLNPMFYITDGMRDTFVNKVWFWENVTWMLYFWVLTIVVNLIGILLYNKLKPHFSDVI
ncbi:MAG: ABC transporter permease [Turicibacter sanguinis]|jgi:ABC-2 type transporter|uniref:ABC transporter permease n=1 Tax=Bacillota TaxID=1239 RepID=UPI0001FD9653|nr:MULTISPECIES: ABC transporter permease [Turicibacter]EGC93475.1 ABC-2 type transporter [Turicibacter sp. HGF1]MCU7197191.1 ABC transporter permease [Turicibacter sanguinis]MDB8438769.1 ABC transporter permease [Turicibacter sanguinis]MDB8459974.1 ABC transporter permease [Turicibacter sanguinis]MDB8545134.1 ABC transporter permease [Turicibacter sanguinis]